MLYTRAFQFAIRIDSIRYAAFNTLDIFNLLEIV